MFNCQDIEGLDVEKLLAEWRWLCPQKLTLVTRNVYGDLFLRDETGVIFLLDVGGGAFEKIADSPEEFDHQASVPEKREEWFAESEETTAASQGLAPGASQCIGFAIPVVFAESGYPGNAYIADLYEHVSFLGDLHHQIKDTPDGSKVQLKIKR